jgi:hypothetical protein
MNMVGRLLMLTILGALAVYAKIVLALIVIFFLGINLAHGKAKWPEDYHPKSKGPVTWKQKVNPWWWMLNDDDPVHPLPEGYIPHEKGKTTPGSTLPKIKNDWFHPTWPQWLRAIGWGWRNPTCNLDRYILGFWDKKDWWTRERRWNRSGWSGKDTMWPLPGERWAICLPFISFQTKKNKKGQHWEFYTGWKPNGEFGWVCFRRKGND